MGNQYSYPEAKTNQTKLKSQVESVASHMQNLQGVITNFMSAEEFNGETGRQMKAFMGEVVMGAMEASNLLIENVERQYETMVNRFQGIDGADDAIIYDSRLDSAIHENDAYAKTLLNKANEMNRLIQQANGLGVSAKPYNTGEVGQYQNIANTKIQELREKLTSEGNKADEASSLDQFINGVRQFVSYLGSCQPSTYNSGALAGEPFYTSYVQNVKSLLKSKTDSDFAKIPLNKQGPLQIQEYTDRIEEMGLLGNEERLNNLLYEAWKSGPEHIDDVILINRLLANKYRNQDDLESALKGERFQGVANWINISGKNKELSDEHGDFYKRNGERKHIDTPFHIKFPGGEDIQNPDYTMISGEYDIGYKRVKNHGDEFNIQLKKELTVEYHFNSNGLQNSYGSKYGKENGGKNAALETVQVVGKDLIIGSLPSFGPVSADNVTRVLSIFEEYNQVEENNETAKSVVASSLADDLHLEGAIVSQGGPSQVQYIQSAETYKEIAEFNKMNNTNYKLSDILDVNSEASRKYLDYKHREDLAKK